MKTNLFGQFIDNLNDFVRRAGCSSEILIIFSQFFSWWPFWFLFRWNSISFRDGVSLGFWDFDWISMNFREKHRDSRAFPRLDFYWKSHCFLSKVSFHWYFESSSDRKEILSNFVTLFKSNWKISIVFPWKILVAFKKLDSSHQKSGFISLSLPSAFSFLHFNWLQ